MYSARRKKRPATAEMSDKSVKVSFSFSSKYACIKDSYPGVIFISTTIVIILKTLSF